MLIDLAAHEFGCGCDIQPDMLQCLLFGCFVKRNYGFVNILQFMDDKTLPLGVDLYL
jgi:hypothetical protein